MKGQQGRLAQEKRNQIVTCLLSDNYGATQDTNKRNNSLLEQENCHSKLLEKKNKPVFLNSTCKCPTRKKSNDCEEQEVPKGGLARVNGKKQTILNDLFKCIS